jgi:hypothetical protein
MNWMKCAFAAAIGSGLAACQGDPSRAGATPRAAADSPLERKLAQYTTVRLTADLGKLSESERLAGQILRFQGAGDYAGVTSFMAERGKLSATLQEDLARLGSKGIPVDIVFEQGPGVLQ